MFFNLLIFRTNSLFFTKLYEYVSNQSREMTILYFVDFVHSESTGIEGFQTSASCRRLWMIWERSRRLSLRFWLEVERTQQVVSRVQILAFDFLYFQSRYCFRILLLRTYYCQDKDWKKIFHLWKKKYGRRLIIKPFFTSKLHLCNYFTIYI